MTATIIELVQRALLSPHLILLLCELTMRSAIMAAREPYPIELHGARRKGLLHGARKKGLLHGAREKGLLHGARRKGLLLL